MKTANKIDKNQAGFKVIPKEPEVIINGTRLNHAQTMTLRVALSVFAIEIDITDDVFADGMAELYKDRITELNKILFSHISTS